MPLEGSNEIMHPHSERSFELVMFRFVLHEHGMCFMDIVRDLSSTSHDILAYAISTQDLSVQQCCLLESVKSKLVSECLAARRSRKSHNVTNNC